MTTIAMKTAPNGKVKIAWDTQATAGQSASFGINKVMAINDQFAIGVAGRLRYANILHRTAVNKVHPFDIAQPDFDGYGWLLDEAVPAWMKAIRREIEHAPDAEEENTPDGHALVALAGRIYEVGTDFAVMPIDGYAAIGSGSSFATTAMHLGKSPKQAVEIAAQLDLFTGGTIREVTV